MYLFYWLEEENNNRKNDYNLKETNSGKNITKISLVGIIGIIN